MFFDEKSCFRKASSFKDSNRRTTGDRRRRPTNPFDLKAYRGRRKTIRRVEDRRRSPYTDHYSRRLFLLCLLLILLCVADALYTLLHVSAGAVEMNPLMDSLLKKGPLTFFWLKFILSACGVVLLALYRHNPFARVMMSALVLIYGALFSYHLFLFFS